MCYNVYNDHCNTEDLNMSESKEYVSKSVENGAIHISEDVLAAMASMAVVEVEGVV